MEQRTIGSLSVSVVGMGCNQLGTKVWLAANRLVGSEAEYGARQTLYAVAEDLPGDSFVGPRFMMRGPTGRVGRSPLARNATSAAALARCGMTRFFPRHHSS